MIVNHLKRRRLFKALDHTGNQPVVLAEWQVGVFEQQNIPEVSIRGYLERNLLTERVNHSHRAIQDGSQLLVRHLARSMR